MSRKVINITHSANKYDILSQTPKNYNKDNYFLKELQEKVSADWNYRPNRVDVEYENKWGAQTYSPAEVVVQSVISEKGTNISNDTRNLVFPNILEDRFILGSRFRFSEDYDITKADIEKNVWMVVNLNKVNMTSSVVVERCNGTLGSTYDNGNDTVSYHYEPVIQGKNLSAVNFFYNQTLISPQSQLLVIAQHNEYTKQYYINQRFVIGYDKVYRIKAINKFYSNSTFNPEDVGLIHIYMEICEEDKMHDDFVNRIAYNDSPEIHIPVNHNYNIVFSTPKEFPIALRDNPVMFTPKVVTDDGKEIEIRQGGYKVSWNLGNLPARVNPSHYVTMEQETATGAFTFARQRVYLNGNLNVIVKVDAEDSPSGEELSVAFSLTMNELGS